MIRQRSSGDLLADRRYAYAEALLGDGDAVAAIELAEQALERAPDFAPAWLLLGRSHEQLYTGSRAQDNWLAAVAAYETALEIDPQDVHGVRIRLAGLGIGDPGAAMSPAYVRTLFDDYAPRFERHLVEDLGYRAPQLLLEALDLVCGRSKQFDVALDLGCGTGLAGEVLRSRVGTLVGIDLSPAILALARDKNIYDRLVEGDLTDFLHEEPEKSAEIVTATDVLIYLGEIDPLLTGVAKVLKPVGYLVVSVQSHRDEGLRLGSDGRFSHGDGYMRASAARHGFDVVAEEVCEIRRERGRGVPGQIVVLRKT